MNKQKSHNGYFFLCHSSKDIEKVRLMRNLIEQENGNPIMFYLKCLDTDNPTGEDEEQLKGLISREISARKKFILCKSKNTEPPHSSKWVEWEKTEVSILRQKHSNIQSHVVDIDDDNYLEKVRTIVQRQRNILLVAPYELREKGREIIQFLTHHNLQVDSIIEEGDIHKDIQTCYASYTKEIVKENIRNLAEKAGIIILLSSNETQHSTITDIAYTYGKFHNCFIKGYNLSKFEGPLLQQIYNDIVELITS